MLNTQKLWLNNGRQAFLLKTNDGVYVSMSHPSTFNHHFVSKDAIVDLKTAWSLVGIHWTKRIVSLSGVDWYSNEFDTLVKFNFRKDYQEHEGIDGTAVCKYYLSMSRNTDDLPIYINEERTVLDDDFEEFLLSGLWGMGLRGEASYTPPDQPFSTIFTRVIGKRVVVTNRTMLNV